MARVALNPGGQVDLPSHRLELLNLGLDLVDAVLLGLEDFVGQVARGVVLNVVGRLDGVPKGLCRRRLLAEVGVEDGSEVGGEESWLGLSEQVLRLDRWSVCRVQAAAVCGSRLK